MIKTAGVEPRDSKCVPPIARAMRPAASMPTLTSVACSQLPARSSRHLPRPR